MIAHSIIITDHHSYIFGNNQNGQLGLGHNNKFNMFKSLPKNTIGGSCGGSHTILITTDGTYVAGKIDKIDSNNFVKIPYNVWSSSSGINHAVLITDRGLVIWGENQYRPNDDIYSVSCGNNHTVFVTETGVAYATGFGTALQLPYRVLSASCWLDETVLLTDEGVYVSDGDFNFRKSNKKILNHGNFSVRIGDYIFHSGKSRHIDNIDKEIFIHTRKDYDKNDNCVHSEVKTNKSTYTINWFNSID